MRYVRTHSSIRCAKFAILTAVSLTVLLMTMGVESYNDPNLPGSGGTGRIEIKIVKTDLWRDWMPEVEDPGHDGGSPLRVRVRIQFDNSKGNDTVIKLADAVLVNTGSYSLDLFPRLQKGSAMWDGHLKAGEIVTVDFDTDKGPYVEAGSPIKIAITFEDHQGNKMRVMSPKTGIRRTF